ncbi:MAG: ABC transporter substrate-binding protein, partial [Chloroflexota bacterium]|nr:ABC transporter substrate-binding protein [Chloroflexota bacterium]
FIFPKHVIDQKGDMKRTVLGTGPFKLKEYMRGVKFSLEKTPDYWVKGQPYLDGIDWYIIMDAGAQFAAIRTGQVQVEIPVNHALLPAQINILKKEIPGIQLQDRNWALNHYFGVNVERKPWTDIRVRKAAFLAMDREAWLKVVLQGSGEIGGFFIPGGYYAYTLDELRTWPGYGKDKDKERAEGKKLMAEAGYPDGLELGEGIIVRNTKEQMDIAIFTADQLAKVGIKAVVRPLDSAEHKLRLFNRNFDTGVKRAIGHGEPDIIGANYFVTGGGENFTGLVTPEIDKIFAEQAQTVDPAKRKALVQKAEKLYYEQYGSLILGWVTGPAILWPEVKGWNNPNRPFLPSRMWDSVWLAK